MLSHFDNDARVLFTSLGSFVLRNGEDFGTLFAILYRGVYDDLTITRNDYVLDAGANIGVFTIYVSVRARHVIAVEPEESNFRLMEENIRRNEISNVSTVRCALSDFDGIGSIAGENTQVVLVSPRAGIPVRVRTMDSLLVELGIPRIDVVKMDIEGSEVNVLRASRFLDDVREIVIETHGLLSTDECIKILLAKGFDVRRIGSGRKFLHHLMKSKEFSDYVVANTRTKFSDFRMYRNFLLSKLSLSIQNSLATRDLGLVYGRRKTGEAD